MSKKKIIARIYGGLGNQLFIYAAARRLALHNDLELIIDDVSGFKSDKFNRKYELDKFNINCRKSNRCERLEPFSRIRRWIKRKVNGLIPFNFRTYIQQDGFKFEPKLLSIKPKFDLTLDGYWQSEDYFKDYEHIIRSDLEIISPIDSHNLSLKDQILNSNSIALHIRFFNSPDQVDSYNAPLNYYKRAIKKMDILIPNAHYFLFSDNPDLVLKSMDLPLNKITIINNNLDRSYLDLWLMIHCKNFIIANSTFSWWAAWLSENSQKIVIAPDIVLNDPKGLTFWNVPHQIPKSWILI
jgi:hypothetical protein